MDEITGHPDAAEPDHHTDRSARTGPLPGAGTAVPAIRPAALPSTRQAAAPVPVPVNAPVNAPVPVPVPANAAASVTTPGTAPEAVTSPAVTGPPPVSTALAVPDGAAIPPATTAPPATTPPAAVPGLAALLRLAVLCVDPDGRISYWNRGAEELFGHRWEHVFGHRAAGLLSTTRPAAGHTDKRPAAARQDTLELLDDITVSSWAGALAATDRDGTLKDVLWWTYRLVEPGGRSLLALAVHAKPLRAGGLRIALGGRLLPYGAEGPQRQDIAVAAVLAPSADPATGQALTGRLAEVLPGASPGRLDRIVRQIAALGHPALEVEDGVRLPVVPQEHARLAAAARAAAPVRRELPPGDGAGTTADPAARGGDASSASALTAVPPPSLTSHASRTAPGLPPADDRAPTGRKKRRKAGGGPAPSEHRSGDGPHLAGQAPPYDGPRPSEQPPPYDPHRPSGRPSGHTSDQPSGHTSDQPGAAPARDPGAGRGRGSRRNDRDRRQDRDRDRARDRDHRPARDGDRDRDRDAHDVLASTPAPHPGNALDEQLALLRAAGSFIGSTLDLGTTARELCAVTVPRFADLASVLVVDQLFSDTEPPKDDRPADTVLVRRVALALPGTPGAWETALPEGELVALPAGDMVPRLGDPVLVPVVDPALAPDIALDFGVPALGPLMAGHSLIVAPLTARGTVLGRVYFLRGPGRRPFDVRDAATAAEVVARGAVHIDNARLHHQESRAAATLQRSMMPTRPPRIPGVRIAHHYMPGDRQAQVGGDWFDAIQLPGGRVALIVGDVMGHGLQAAAVMGQFRTAVITMTGLDLPPAQLLRHLDNLAHRLGTEHLATCVYAVYDPIHRTLTLANAGHIPPVLAGSDGHGELLRIPGGAPIGVGGVPFETVEVPAPDGSWLVLCTDGLVEVRGQGIDAGLAALCANVIEPQQSPEDVCAQILARVHSDDRRDDVALLVARFEGVAPQDVVRWSLLIDYAEVSRARELTRRQLAAWGLERLSDVAELLVSELVTNAIKAASYEVELRLMRVGKLLVEVSDDNHHLPQLRSARADDVTGRGLGLVSNLARRWGTSRKAVGKVVWFELPLPS